MSPQVHYPTEKASLTSNRQGANKFRGNVCHDEATPLDRQSHWCCFLNTCCFNSSKDNLHIRCIKMRQVRTTTEAIHRASDVLPLFVGVVRDCFPPCSVGTGNAKSLISYEARFNERDLTYDLIIVNGLQYSCFMISSCSLESTTIRCNCVLRTRYPSSLSCSSICLVVLLS